MKRISETERQALLAEARRMAEAVHFETGLTLRAAADVEAEIKDRHRCICVPYYSNNVIPFPIHGRRGRC